MTQDRDLLSELLEYPPGHAGPWSFAHIISVEWWLQHFHDAYVQNPFHFFIEASFILVIIYLALRKPYSLEAEKPLSKKEEDALIAEWIKDRAPSVDPVDDDALSAFNKPITVASASGRAITTTDGKTLLNFASFNFLDLTNNAEVKQAAAETIRELGVGSCGPRGFYGTSTVHMALEARLAKHLGTEGCAVYSDGIACISSVIPSFAKGSDVCVVDDKVHYLVQQGLMLSRAQIVYYEHNNMKSLRKALSGVVDGYTRRTINRRFVVTEGVFLHTGEICPLDEVIKLKDEFKFRLILDDTLGFGTLSATGTPGHFGAPVTDVDVYVAGLDCSIGSVGGLCAGIKEITEHQILAGSGYCFSASAPPFTARAAIAAVDALDQKPELVNKLLDVVGHTRQALRSLPGFKTLGSPESPVIHLVLSSRAPAAEQEERATLAEICDAARAKGVAIFQNENIPRMSGRPRPSIRVLVSAAHTREDIRTLVQTLKETSKKILA